MKLQTKRLILRPFAKGDISNIVENINNLKVTKWLLVVPYPYKRKDAIWWVENCKEKAKAKPRKDYNFGIELKEEHKIIGGIGLHRVNKNNGTAELGYWLGEKYWRQGYGSEALENLINFAFNKLKLRRLGAEVFAENPSSGKLLEKYGFKREGLKRQAQICKADGKIKDEILYGLLRKEYKVTRKI
ncbi:MAG: GNAT family protein [archaeon]|nr:GNAT family protein [archaeon]